MSGSLGVSRIAIDQFAVALISHFEGFRANPYQDQGGVWTIGYGTTRINGWAVVANTPPCTPTQARAWLINDMGFASRAVAELVTPPLTDAQRAALISLIYNIGVGHFTASTLRKQINAKTPGADAHFLDWDMCAGAVNAGLLGRRKMERAVYTGALTYADFIRIFPLPA